MQTFEEANQALRQFWPDKLSRKLVYTRETMVRLVDFLGNPQNKLKVIHVAGTSGKTSTAYYAAALLKAAGKKVGLTVSPHVDEVNERVQIDLTPLPEAHFCAELDGFLRLVKKSGVEPSYFEALAAFAFWEFGRRGVEYAVVEVGLGGLVDATNVTTNPGKVCVITDIGLDHVNVLGNSLGEIAQQKAGIIGLHNNVFCYRQGREVVEQIEARARQQQAELHVLSAKNAESGLDFLPLFQQRNLGLARAAVNQLLAQDDQPALTDDMVATAAQTHIPARMEIIKLDSKTIIVDGAHNAQKLHALSVSVRRQFPRKPIAAVVSFVGGRSFRLEDSTAELARLADHLIITTFNGPQDGPHASVDAEELAKLFKRHGATSIQIVPDPKQALHTLLGRPEPVLMVAGSFYLLNHIRPLLPKHHT